MYHIIANGIKAVEVGHLAEKYIVLIGDEFKYRGFATHVKGVRLCVNGRMEPDIMISTIYGDVLYSEMKRTWRFASKFEF